MSSITNSTRPFSKLRTAHNANSPIEQINVTETEETEKSDSFFDDKDFPAADEIFLQVSINFAIFGLLIDWLNEFVKLMWKEGATEREDIGAFLLVCF